MAAEPQLTPACELAYVVAREGLDQSSAPAVPAALQHFLTTAEPSRRAFRAAQRVLEADDAFRRRVAQRATEESVGRAGWLWLHRPAGWDAELSELLGHRRPAGGAAEPVPDQEPVWNDDARPADTGTGQVVVAMDAPADAVEPDGDNECGRAEAGADGSGPADLDDDAECGADAEPDVAAAADPAVDPAATDGTPALVEGERSAGSSAIEHELQTLRSMVERLVSGHGYEAGPAVRQLGVELAAAEQAREDLAVALAVVTDERDRAVDRASSLVEQVARLRAEVAEVTAQRVGLQAELEQVESRRTELARAHDAMLADLAEELQRARADRDRAAVEVARSDDQVQRVRQTLERALADVDVAVTGFGPVLGSANEALTTVEASLGRAVEQARWLQRDFAAAAVGSPVRPPKPADRAAPADPAPHADLPDQSGQADQGDRADAADWADVAHLADRADAADWAELAESAELAELAELAGLAGLADAADWADRPDPGDPADRGDRGDAADWAALADQGDRLAPADRVGLGPSAAGNADIAGGVQDGDSDPFAQDLSELSKGLSDALALYLIDQDAADPAAEAFDDDPQRVEALRESWSDRGGPAGRAPSGRRAVEVPPELLDDQLAAARFLVSIADVVLIIDGDEVATLGWPTLEVADRRDALVSYLGDLTAGSGPAADVVFDGAVGGEDALPPTEVVRVRLTVRGVSARSAVATLVDTYPVDWPVVVVTGDPALAAEIEPRGAAVLPALGLLDLFIAQ